MHVKKTILWIMLLLLASFVLAEPDFYFQEETLVDLKVPCFENNTICSSLITCNISINYPNGSNMVNNEAMTKDMVYYNYTLSDSSVLGEYYAVVLCTDTLNQGFGSLSFEINKEGREETTQQAIIYLIGLIVTIMIFVILLLWAYNIDSKNQFKMGHEGEYYIEINYGAYLKFLMYYFSYLFFWISTWLVWQISDKFIISSTIPDILRLIWVMVSIGILPTTIIVFILFIFKHLTDSEITRLHRRRLFKR